MMALVRQDFSLILLTSIQLPSYSLFLVLFLVFWFGFGFFFSFLQVSIFTVTAQGNPSRPATGCLSAFAAVGMSLLLCPIWP